jgi:hypothetical protein
MTKATENTSDQASIASWWPLEDTWNKGRLNVGYWSQEAEDWFQNRMVLIRKNSAQPMTQREWKKYLRQGKETNMFQLNMETLSSRSL